MSTAAEEWTRFCNAALLQVCRDSRRHIDAWARLPALVRLGALRRQADGWYQVSDLGACVSTTAPPASRVFVTWQFKAAAEV
jgi:hypothetical protein